MFEEKRCATARRPQLDAALRSLKPGDLLVVYKIDRVARSLSDLPSILRRTEAAGAGFQSLTEPIATTTSAGRMMLQQLGAFAGFAGSPLASRTEAGVGKRPPRDKLPRPISSPDATYVAVSRAIYWKVRHHMSKRPHCDCRLTIDGNQIDAIISPHIGRHGFSLWNEALGARAHFNDLKPGSASLHDVLQKQAGKAFAVQLLDEKLGSIDEYRGYAAADMGPHTRRVISLRLGLSPNNGKLTFRFEGTAGPVDPGSIFQGTPTAFMRAQYREPATIRTDAGRPGADDQRRLLSGGCIGTQRP